jgi:hypothetical protein
LESPIGWREDQEEGGGSVTEPSAFVSSDFDPPIHLTVGQFRLEPIGPEHNERDHVAWTSSMDHIRRSPGYSEVNWPREMSLDENRADLERHARDFRNRTGFTFTVLDQGDDVVGCVYIYPADDGLHDATVWSWVRESKAEHDEVLRRAVAEWLKSDAWPFMRPLYEPFLS